MSLDDADKNVSLIFHKGDTQKKPYTRECIPNTTHLYYRLGKLSEKIEDNNVFRGFYKNVALNK
jgi:hypothetical protein